MIKQILNAFRSCIVKEYNHHTLQILAFPFHSTLPHEMEESRLNLVNYDNALKFSLIVLILN